MQKYITMLAAIILSVAYSGGAKAQKREFKHGVSFSTQRGDVKGDVKGKHLDYKNFIGTNPEAITSENANVLDGIIGDSRSFGYNLRYIPAVGWGYEVGISQTEVTLPKQKAALKHDDGSAFTVNTPQGPANVVVDSPESKIKTVDIYFGGIYRFTAVQSITPYVGAGYAKTKGKWTKSYYRGTPGGPEYGTKGETDTSGSNKSVKVGLDLNNGFSVEWKRSINEFKADSFRSFNINGASGDYEIDTLQLLYHF